MLWLGRTDLPKEQKEEFIQRLVNFKDGCGKFYSDRAYLLAAAGIAEFAECGDRLANKIVKQIVTWGFDDFDSKKRRWITFPYDFANEASITLQQTQRTKAINALVQLLSNTNLDNFTRLSAAESLEKIDTGNEHALVVIAAFKGYFNGSQEFSNEYLFNVIWRCSENILYPKFYQAWHQGSRTNRATQNLDIAILFELHSSSH